MRRLYLWVLAAIALGAGFGLAFPAQAAGSKWLADLFLNLVKVVTGPTIFLTVVVGIVGLGSLAAAGGLAARALGYFMAMTAIALLLGLAVGNVLRPGDGLNLADPAVPVVGIALLVGVDRFMSEARSLINVVSNGVATLAIARWQGDLDRDRLREVLTQRRRGATTGLPSSAVSTVTDAA